MRLIDADAEAKWASEHILDAKERYSVIDFLRDCSTIDAVPVVRCMDCKKGELVPDFDGLYSCRGKRKPLHDPDDFCNFGVKREDG